MLKVKTLNNKLSFENKDKVIEYFDEGITAVGQDYFDNNNYYIEIEGDKIYTVEDWEWWKENFSEIVFNVIEELEELKGREVTLLEMDNTIQSILYESDESGKSSIFEGDIKDYIERGEKSYTIWTDEEQDKTVDINIHFEVLEDDANNFDIIVKITEMELL